MSKTEKSRLSGKSMRRNGHESPMSAKSGKMRELPEEEDRSVGLRTELQEQFKLLTGVHDHSAHSPHRILATRAPRCHVCCTC